MKCNICGAYNKPEYKKCIRCGNPLISEEEAAKQKKILFDHHSTLKNTPTFREAVIVESEDKEPVEKDIKPQRHKRAERENDLWHGNDKKKKHHSLTNNKKNIPVVSILDESSGDDASDSKKLDKKVDPSAHVAKNKRRVQKGSNLDKISKFKEGQEVEILLPPEQRAKKKKKTKPVKKNKLKWGRIILVSVVAGSLIIGMVIGFFYLFQGISSSVSSIFSGHEELPNGGEPLVERVMINGETWHRITFYGEDGQRILVEDPVRSLSIQDNQAVLLLDDDSYIPEEDDEDSEEYVEVALEAYLFTEDGEEIELDVDSYKIPVPESPLVVVYPTDPDIEVEYTQVLVKLKVDVGSRVIVDSVNLTDLVDDEGYVQKYVNLNEGVNSIEVEVETYKHRTTYETITVTRPELDVAIELDEPDAESDEDEIWIYGFCEEDADIYVDTSRLSADVSYGDTQTIEYDDGTTKTMVEFQFKYVLSSYGTNEIEITATTTDGRTATLVHKVEREPNHLEYTKQAWPVDYDYLSNSTTALIGQVFACEGQVISREDTDTSRMFLMNVGTENDTQFVMIEYSGTQEFLVGEYYSVYADVSGTYDNYPLLTARFIYDLEVEEDEDTETTDEDTEDTTDEETTDE